MSKLAGNVSYPIGINPYLIGSNVCNAFVIGEIGSDEEFFLIASPPQPDSNYPMITGNFLDSEGKVIFKLIQNNLIINPGHCSKILSDRVGYEINDHAGNLILKVATRFESLPGQNEELWVTTIEGNFFNKQGTRVVEANGSEGFIETSIGCAMGFNGTAFAFNLGMSDEQLQIAGVAITTFGKVFQPISGTHENEDILLDGKILMPDTIIKNSKVTIVTGDFMVLGKITIAENQVFLNGPAFMIAKLLGTQINNPEQSE